MPQQGIVILDFGGQYTHLIARAVRKFRVYSEILYPDTDEKDWHDAKGIILSGGPSSVYDKDAPPFNPRIFHSNVPLLGICYGLQLTAKEMGGRVEKSKGEYGPAKLNVVNHGRILKGFDKEENVWVSHGDSVLEIPENFKHLGYTDDCKYAAIEDEKRRMFGVQFHPEVAHTEHGMKIFENFIFNICGCEPNWSMENYASEQIQNLRRRINGKAIIGLSGGVDSSTAAILTKEAIGGRLYGIFVDHGLLRKGETEELKSIFDSLGVNYKIIDARERFLNRLRGVTDPELKRKIIGEEFIRVFEKEGKKSGQIILYKEQFTQILLNQAAEGIRQ